MELFIIIREAAREAMSSFFHSLFIVGTILLKAVFNTAKCKSLFDLLLSLVKRERLNDATIAGVLQKLLMGSKNVSLNFFPHHEISKSEKLRFVK
jgi:hypothetical protein